MFIAINHELLHGLRLQNMKEKKNTLRGALLLWVFKLLKYSLMKQ